MADYRRPVEFGANADPLAANPRLPLEVARVADAAGLELVGVQDHPYNRAFLDTWTLLATLAPQTRRVRLFPDVADLPLRPPAMLAKAVATLDVLGGGRVEVGLGAGALWDAIRAYGGPVRTPGEAVAALEEAIQVMRLLWQGQRGARFTRRHYRLEGAGLRPPSGLTRGRGLSQQPKPSPQEPDPAAVDLAHHAGMTAVQADFVALTEGGQDVILFTRSLHHLADLGGAVEHAHRLLAPDGTLVADEFARERANRATAAFFYGLRGLLETAGLLRPTDADAEADEAAMDPLERWRAQHAGRPGHPLHESHAMLAALRACFPVVEVESCAYLYRPLGEQLEGIEQGLQLTQRLLDLEQQMIQAGALTSVGLRFRARRGTG